MFNKFKLAAFVLAVLPASPVHADGQGSFGCERMAAAAERSNAIKLYGTNKSLMYIVWEYLNRWDAQTMRELCDEYAAGLPADISCLNGKRDWAEIKAAIPADYFSMSHKGLMPALQKERAIDPGLKSAVRYCEDLGALRKEVGW